MPKSGRKYNMRKRWRNFKHKIASSRSASNSNADTMPQCARSGHACCAIDDHRMIIVGGYDATGKRLANGVIYNARTERWKPLPNDMPSALYGSTAVATARYMYVIGGLSGVEIVNTVYRLSLTSYKWKTLSMAPMRTARFGHASVRKGSYIYVFGGLNGGRLASAERYSIVDDAWEILLDMAEARVGHCAVTAVTGNYIYIVGGYRVARSLVVFDTVSLRWIYMNAPEVNLRNMPCVLDFAAAVMIYDRYLVVIGGEDEEGHVVSSCLIYNCVVNSWTSAPVSMNINAARSYHISSVLDGKIVVAGGIGTDEHRLSSVEFIGACDLLEYAAPLTFPLPTLYFNHILYFVKANDGGAHDNDGNTATCTLER